LEKPQSTLAAKQKEQGSASGVYSTEYMIKKRPGTAGAFL